jgi:uncharacterized protein YjbI with pentapeptide repeats
MIPSWTWFSVASKSDTSNDPGSGMTNNVELDEAQSRVTKLQLESRLLKRQLSRWFTGLEILKSLASIAGVMTAIVALAAFFWSVWNGLEQLNLAREGRNQERLNAAIKLIGDANENQRSTGVLSLQEFLTSKQPEYQRRVLLILTNQLAYESSSSVRKKTVDILNQIDEKSIGREVLSEALRSLVDSSRTLMNDGKVKRAILENDNLNIPTTPEQIAMAKSVGDAIATLIRKGATEPDLSGIFCLKCDFRNTKLSKVKFDRSLLSFADFSEATLDGASFVEALLESTKFISADLRNANLRGRGLSPFALNLTEVDDEFYALNRDDTHGPVFNCADLRGATFDNRVIFTFISDDRKRAGTPYWSTSFVNTHLDQADFSRAVIIGLDNAKEKELPFAGSTASSRSSGWPVALRVIKALKKEENSLPDLDRDEQTFRIKLTDSATLSAAKNRFVSSFKIMETAFTGSSWRAAKLPKGVADYLNSPETVSKEGGYFIRYSENRFDRPCHK